MSPAQEFVAKPALFRNSGDLLSRKLKDAADCDSVDLVD